MVYEKSANYDSATAYGGKVRTYQLNNKLLQDPKFDVSNFDFKKSFLTSKNPSPKPFRENPVQHYLAGKTDLCLLGTFENIGWESQINGFLGAHPSSRYWLPWGNRTISLKTLLGELISKSLWCSKPSRRQEATLLQPIEPTQALKFFHYRSKAQGGNTRTAACILTRYTIDRIVLAPKPIAPTKEVSHSLLKSTSNCWFGINAYRLCDQTSSQPLDFLDFDLVDLKGKQTHPFHFKNDSWRLYEDIAIVRHFSHKNFDGCRCQQCR